MDHQFQFNAGTSHLTPHTYIPTPIPAPKSAMPPGNTGTHHPETSAPQTCQSLQKRIVVSFVLDGRIDGRIDGMVFFGYVFPLFRVRRSTGRRGLSMKERLIGVADDRLIERVFLI